MIKARILLVAAGFWLSIMAGCGGGSDQSANDRSGATQRQQEELEPAPFNADSAYAYIQKQVDFGPRVPNTAAERPAGLPRRYSALLTPQVFRKVRLRPTMAKRFTSGISRPFLILKPANKYYCALTGIHALLLTGIRYARMSPFPVLMMAGAEQAYCWK